VTSPGPDGSSAGGRSATGPRDLLFFFDFASPFAYLGATQVEGVAARHGARLFYRPFLLGGLFKQIGTPDVPFFAMPAAKQRHTSADMVRWADHWGVPFRFPSRFPMNTTKPLRMVLQLAEPDRARLVHPIFRAYWAEDRDISSDDVLAEIALDAGLEGRRLVAMARETRWKNALRSATERAEQMGVCGAPCFMVREPTRPQQPLLFWGQDRLLLVERALQGWQGGPFDGQPQELPEDPAPPTRPAPERWPALAALPESITRVPLQEPTRFEPLAPSRAAQPLDEPSHTNVRAPLPSAPEENTRPDHRGPLPSLSEEVTRDVPGGPEGAPSEPPASMTQVGFVRPDSDEPE
jgi:2-hydroxychromene-2-carboxylate isomerase